MRAPHLSTLRFETTGTCSSAVHQMARGKFITFEGGEGAGKSTQVSRGENVVLEVPLQAGEDVEGGKLHQRAFDAVGELVINVFRAGVDRF